MIFDFLKGSEASDILLVFVHGSGCNKKFLRALAEEVTEYDRVLVDLPCHGEDDSVIFSYSNYISTLSDFIKGYADKQVVVIGHSLGGTLTIDVATRNLPNVKACISLSGSAKFSDLDKDFMDKIHKGIVDFDYLSSQADTQYPDVVEALGNLEPENVVLRDFLIDEKVDITSQIENIKTPLILLAGSDDELGRPEYSIAINNKVKNYTSLIILQGFKHMLCIAKKDLVASIIRYATDRHCK